ncbi:hypothetical protein DL767_004308 [Monosporascus sp. MG133]|nr:hypothetical protein DL767_004308 [Monosporascus sp. MG133]
MEALAAVSLSSNILQFVELSAKLVRTANELRHDASTSENKDHAAIAEHLETIANGVKASAQEIEGASAAVSPEEKALLPVAEGCSALAQDLLRQLKACGVGAQQADKRFNRAKRTLRCMWNKREIDEINTRLQYFRSELGLHMTYGIKQAQAQSHASQASANDIGVLRDSMQALRVKSDANAAEILRSVAEVRVENSRFHAQATQAPPAALGCEASLQHLMRSLFDEYEERFLEGVEKRFRGAARLEMATARASLLQDPRGKPKLELQLETYRILDNDHEVWSVIKSGDITTLRTMLSQRLVSPSDRGKRGKRYFRFGDNALFMAFQPYVYFQANGSAIFHFLRSLPQASMEVFWDNSSATFRHNMSYDKGYADVFDALVQRIGGVGLGQRPEIPVGAAALNMALELPKTRSQGSMGMASSPEESVLYRGYYVSERLAAKLRFLEHVISTGITAKPDCIFDTYMLYTVYEVLPFCGQKDVWDQILEEHGFDPAWAREENERRKRMVTGETSAHEVKVRVDTAEVQQMKRRRAYERED